jgi:hypothetical protein
MIVAPLLVLLLGLLHAADGHDVRWFTWCMWGTRYGIGQPNVTRTHANCPGRRGRLSAPSVFLCKSVLYGAFVWARRALKSKTAVSGPGSGQGGEPRVPAEPLRSARDARAPPQVAMGRRVIQTPLGIFLLKMPMTYTKRRLRDAMAHGYPQGRGGRL